MKWESGRVCAILAKAFGLALLVVLAAGQPSRLQAQLMVQASPGLSVIVGPHEQSYKVGGGGDLLIRYRFEKPFAVALTSGWFSHRSALKEAVSFSYVPLLGSFEYYFRPEHNIRPYVALEAGAFFGLLEDGFDSQTGTDFGMGPLAGTFFILGNSFALDVRLRYRRWLSTGTHFASGMAALNLCVGAIIPF